MFHELRGQLYKVSQHMEHWLSEPVVLKQWARHYETGEPIPDALLNKMFAARKFNQGFDTVEYTSSALVDLALHKVGQDGHKVAGEFCKSADGENLVPMLDIDLNAFEALECDRLGMPQGIALRHRPAHFQHIFATAMYASAYYVYLWAAVLDNDAFEAFKEAGDPFHKETATRLRAMIYSKGNSQDPSELYRKFRGQEPKIDPMLRKKGLLE